MTPSQIAAIRAHDVANPESFMLAFHAGQAAAGQDVDTARFLRSLLDDGHASSAAGFLEGLAAAHAEAGMPTTAVDPFWRRDALRAGRVAA